MADEIKIIQPIHELMFSETLSKEEVHRILVSNSTSEFDKLRGVPGISVDPITWEMASDLVKENTVESLGKLGRSPAGLVAYWRFKAKIAKEYVGITDYIKIIVFQKEYVMLPDGRKQAVPGDLARSSGDVFIVWRPNDFPYHYEDGIEHHVLWSSQALTHERIEQEIKERRKGYETVYWINPPVIMSIPGVWHCHILSRKPA